MWRLARGLRHFAVIGMLGLMLIAVGCGQQSVANKSTSGAGTEEGSKATESGEKFPSRPIRVILTHSAGGSVDTQARLIAPFVEKYLGTPLVLENMEGAGGRKARAFVYNAKPDGYTLMVTGQPSTVIGELLYQGSYKTLDFTYIYNFMGKDYSVITVSSSSPIKTYKDLVELSKQKKIKLGTAGTGTTDHLAAVMLKRYTGLDFDIVPFDSTAEQLMALVGGKLDAVMDAISSSGVRSDVRVLAVMGPERSELLPDVPTVSELGYPAMDVSYSLGFVGPPGMPEDRRKVLEEAVRKAANDPEYLAKLKEMKSLPLPLDGAKYKDMVNQLYNSVQSVIPLMQAQVTGAK